jgi:hypothetical protein
MKSLASNLLCLMISICTFAQTADRERMNRDIEVAENVLTTMIKQQFSNQRMFFPLEINGHYQEGYGITFRLPADYTTPIVFTTIATEGNNSMTVGNTNGYTINRDEISTEGERSNSIRLTDKTKEKRTMDMDSIRGVYDKWVIDAAKSFLLDYGDMLTQLGPNERLVITNQGNQPRPWVNQFFNSSKRSLLSIEALKSDLMSFKSGKLTREQALPKIRLIHTETVEAADPDLELLASMINRIYRPDLSKTYFTENYVYYEKLKDFGVIYYLQMLSSNEMGFQRYLMPTIGLENVDLATRNKKVTELYPKFEQELKENMVEYGRTLKSLKENEVLVFQIRMTRCPECGIPSSLELIIKGSVLKDFAAGKIDQAAAISKIILRTGEKQ